MIPVAVQFKALVAMILFGFAMGIGFDIYRELKRILKLRSLTTKIWDLLIWLFFLVAAYGVLLYTNYGEVRLYIFMAIALGLLIYFRFFSRIAVKPIRILLLVILKVLSFVWKVVRVPFILMHRILMLPANLISLLIFKLISPIKRVKGRVRANLKARFHKKNIE